MSSEARDVEAFWTSIYEAITPYEYDFPTAVLYSHVGPDAVSPLGYGRITPRHCTLEWTIGYADDHPEIPEDLDLGGNSALARALINSAKNGAATLYHNKDGALPSSVFVDVEKRGFGDPCKAFLIIPIRTSSETITGYLLVGVNTRRPYDTEYQDWIEVFSKLLGVSAALVALHEEEVRRRKHQEEQAAEEREALNAEVAVLAQEANEVAEKLQNFHNVANTVGLGYFEFSVNGQLMHANVSWAPF
jgi:vacuolar-type H+-ATPase subunit F/Vma7